MYKDFFFKILILIVALIHVVKHTCLILIISREPACCSDVVDRWLLACSCITSCLCAKKSLYDWVDLQMLSKGMTARGNLKHCVYNMDAWGYVWNTAFKQSSVYLKSDHVSVWVSVYFSPLFAYHFVYIRVCMCTVYCIYNPVHWVHLCVHVCMCVSLSLAWGSSSCVRVSRSKCLNSQKRKKRGEQGGRLKGEQHEWEGGCQRNEWRKWWGSITGPGGRREQQELAGQREGG